MTITTTYALTTTLTEFFGNTYILQNEFSPTVVSNGGGGFLLSYGRTFGSNIGPLVDFYNAGTATPSRGYLAPYSVSDDDVDLVGAPDMIRLSNGNYAVVWDSATEGGGDIRGAIFNSAGSIVAADFEVSSFSTDNDPQITALTNGNWVAVMDTGSTIYAQLMSSAGARIGGQISVGSSAPDTDASVTALNDGGFALAWTADNGVGTDAIWIAIRNADGTQRVAPVDFSAGLVTGDNSQSALARLNNGNIALVYKDSGWSGDGITLQIINPTTGANITPGSFIRVDSNEAAIEQDPEVTVLSNGFIAVTWTHPFGGTDNDIYGRLFTQSGTPVQVSGSDIFIIAGSGLNQTQSSVAALLEGRFVTAWTDSTAETGGAANSIRVEVNQLTETQISDAASDVMVGSFGIRSSLFGGAGNDTITSDGDGGRYDGGTGNDIMTSGNGAETMFGGDGRDVIDHSWYSSTYNFDMTTGLTNFGGELYQQFEVVRMGGGNDSVGGTIGGDTIRGGAGNDDLFGLDGNDRLDGESGQDDMQGGRGNDVYVVDNANDSVSGEIGFSLGGGIDTVESYIDFTLQSNFEILRLMGSANINGTGSGGPDALVGNSGINTLTGGFGNDQINGKSGADRIIGGAGSDTLVGEAGADTFVYLAATDSGVGAGVRDFINGFVHGVDRIDLSAIDANAIGGAANDAFSFITTGFTGVAGQLRAANFGGNYCIVEGDRDGNGAADMQIFVNLTTFMVAGDFFL